MYKHFQQIYILLIHKLHLFLQIKSPPVRSFLSHRGRNTLCLSQHREHAGSDSGGFCAGSGDLVGVDGLGGVGVGMAQLVGGGHGVNAVSDKD